MEELNNELIEACSQGNLEKVQYLLTTPGMKEHVSINDLKHSFADAITGACENGRTEIMRYNFNQQGT